MSFLDYITAGLGIIEVKEPTSSSRNRTGSKLRSRNFNRGDMTTKTLDYSFHDRKIAIFEPVEFKDIVAFTKNMGGNVPLIVNFSHLNPDIAERGLDFVCGAVCALDGKFERIGEGIYFFAPKGIAVDNRNIARKGRK